MQNRVVNRSPRPTNRPLASRVSLRDGSNQPTSRPVSSRPLIRPTIPSSRHPISLPVLSRRYCRISCLHTVRLCDQTPSGHRVNRSMLTVSARSAPVRSRLNAHALRGPAMREAPSRPLTGQLRQRNSCYLSISVTHAGTSSPAGPRRLSWNQRDPWLASRFNSSVRAPRSRACRTSPAAG